MRGEGKVRSFDPGIILNRVPRQTGNAIAFLFFRSAIDHHARHRLLRFGKQFRDLPRTGSPIRGNCLPGLDLDNFQRLAPLHQRVTFQAGLVAEEKYSVGLAPVKPLLDDFSRGSMPRAIITATNPWLCLLQSHTLNWTSLQGGPMQTSANVLPYMKRISP